MKEDILATDAHDIGPPPIGMRIDLTDIAIDISLQPELRMQSYLAQIKNPYCFFCKKTPVTLCFNAQGQPLLQVIEKHFSHSY